VTIYVPRDGDAEKIICVLQGKSEEKKRGTVEIRNKRVKRHAIQSMDAYEIKAKNQKCQAQGQAARGKMYNTKKNLTRQPDLFRVELN
jgi:hypothetical protein